MTHTQSTSTAVGPGRVTRDPVSQSASLCAPAESKLFVRFDIWEQGNVSPLQLSDKLQGALRHALCDVLMELKVLPNPLCVLGMCPATKTQADEAKGESTLIDDEDEMFIFGRFSLKRPLPQVQRVPPLS